MGYWHQTELWSFWWRLVNHILRCTRVIRQHITHLGSRRRRCSICTCGIHKMGYWHVCHNEQHCTTWNGSCCRSDTFFACSLLLLNGDMHGEASGTCVWNGNGTIHIVCVNPPPSCATFGYQRLVSNLFAEPMRWKWLGSTPTALWSSGHKSLKPPEGGVYAHKEHHRCAYPKP